MFKNCLLIIGLIIISHTTFASNSGDTSIPKKRYDTKRLTGKTITLDGVPNEDAWNLVEWAGDFTQWQPNEGRRPSQPTRFKILYDNKFLYVAYDCYDSTPNLIEKRMARRDDFPGDFVEINIDNKAFKFLSALIY